jgi:N-acetylglutamate synthase-like GNAT family acetyltransferase
MITSINEWKLFKYSKNQNIKYLIDHKTYGDNTAYYIKLKSGIVIGRCETEIITHKKEFTVGLNYQEEPYIYLRLLLVNEKYQQLGFGKILMDYVINDLKHKDLNIYISCAPLFKSTSISIESLTKFYSNFGFKRLKPNKYGYDMVLYNK